MDELQQFPLWFYIILMSILVTQSIYLYIDARKRGHARWFWGLWGMIQAPMPILLYLLWSRVIIPARKKRRNE